MNWHKKLLAAALALTGLLAVHFDSRAQGFRLGVSASPNPVPVNNPILYSIDVTNFSGLTLNDVFVTNAISGAVAFNGATNSLGGSVTTGSEGIVFFINTMFNGQVARLSLSISPNAAGPFTNEITVATFGLTNVTTNIVTQVNFPTADLAVGMTNVASSVLTNDLTVIGLFATNLGPSSAAGVVVSNSFPASFTLVSVSPPTASYTNTATSLRWNVGTLASGVARQLFLTVRPTSAGTNHLTASVTGNVNDTNTANNAVTNTLIAAGSQGNLAVVELNRQFNLQTGLLEVRARVTNTNATGVDAARVIASSLSPGARLYNASGTNSGNAYVLYNAAIPAGNFADLMLEFYVLKVSTFTNTLSAYGVPAINLTAPTNSGVIITNKGFSSLGFLIEFPATIGRTYTIVYSDNFAFSNALVAQPPIVAPATQVQWIDNGPPKTVSHPTVTGQRWYRVFQSQ